MKILRKNADYRALGFILAYFVWVTFLWQSNPANPHIRVVLIFPACVLSWLGAVIAHNTLHHPIFLKRTWNRVFQTILTVTYGFPVSEYIPGHNLSHHRFTQTPKDVMRTSKVQFKSNFLNLLFFMPAVAGDVTRANMKYVQLMKSRRPAWYRQFLFEFTACWGSKLVLLLIDWRKCLLYIVIPHLSALWGITTINYLWHDGCDPEDPYNHSRNFVGRFFNWLTFNNGYHGMHHMQPGLHWSLLPEAHRKLLGPYVHPALEQKSLFVYAFKSIIFPGKRLDFDGSPIDLLPRQPDEDWIFPDRTSSFLQAT